MSSQYRRYEVLLPLRFNDGQPIPDELLGETLLELEEQFGAASCETQSIRGFWRHEGQSYRDESSRIYVDVPDLAENRQFFEQYKEKLKARFQQIDIWITAYPVDVL